ncbi:MAG: YqjK family protein [Pseudomonadota bacterium]
MSYTSRRIDIARHKEWLLGRIEQQRGVIAAAANAWERPAGIIDRGIGAVIYLKNHPLLLVFGVVVMAAVGRRNFVGWVGRGWVLWRGWRSLGNWIRKSGV